MTAVAIAFGANRGDARAQYRRVRTMLDGDGLRVRGASDLYRSDAVGDDGGEYLNACLVADTRLSAEETLARLLAAERSLGRVRTGHWSPRTVDLDLIVHGATVLRTPDCTVPHPRCHLRRFVLTPLVRIAPDLRIPVVDRTVSDLDAALAARRAVLLGGDADTALAEAALAAEGWRVVGKVRRWSAAWHAGLAVRATLAAAGGGDASWAVVVGRPTGPPAAEARSLPGVDVHAADAAEMLRGLRHFLQSARPVRPDRG